MNKGNFLALTPIFVFLLLFLGGGLIAKNMSAMPTLLCFLITLVVAFLQNRKVKMSDKLVTFAKGVGNKNIMTMVLIFLLAGIFTGAVGEDGVNSTVNFALSIIPAELSVVGLFLIACFLSMAMGTSVGTITALSSIGYGIAIATNFVYSAPLCLSAVVSGAMFGDNLSMVSDTTIAAVSTQGCKMKDKFKQNFLIVLPAAIISVCAYIFLAYGKEVKIPNELTYNFWEIVPYLFVLISALSGLNVFIALSGGSIIALIIRLALNKPGVTFWTILEDMSNGMAGMYNISLISIIVAGIVELVKANGGIDAVIYAIRKSVKGKRGAEAGIALLVTLIDFFTANNTVAIVIAGPIAKDIATDFDISPKKSAAILDIFASFGQGIIIYGAQLLAASEFEYNGESIRVPAIKILPYLIYPYAMMVCAVIFIIFFTKDKKKLKENVALAKPLGDDTESSEENFKNCEDTNLNVIEKIDFDSDDNLSLNDEQDSENHENIT